MIYSVAKRAYKNMFYLLLTIPLLIFLLSDNTIPYKSRSIDYTSIAKLISECNVDDGKKTVKNILGYDANVLYDDFSSPVVYIDDTTRLMFKRFEFENEDVAKKSAQNVMSDEAFEYLCEQIYNYQRLQKYNENAKPDTEYFHNLPENWCYLVSQDDTYTIYSTYSNLERYSWDHIALANLPFGGKYTLVSIQTEQYVYLVLCHESREYKNYRPEAIFE